MSSSSVSVNSWRCATRSCRDHRGHADRRIVGDARGRRRGPRAARRGRSPSRRRRGGQGEVDQVPRAAGCIDEQCSSDAKRRDTTAVDEHSRARGQRVRSTRTSCSRAAASPGACGRSSASCTASSASGPRRGIARSCRRCPPARSRAACPRSWGGARQRRRRSPSVHDARWPSSSCNARPAWSVTNSRRCLTPSSRPARRVARSPTSLTRSATRRSCFTSLGVMTASLPGRRGDATRSLARWRS